MALQAAGWDAELLFDRSKPDGVERKLMDSSRMRALGWAPEIKLPDGIADTYRRMFPK